MLTGKGQPIRNCFCLNNKVVFTIFTRSFSPPCRPHPDRIPADVPDPQDYDLQRHAGLRRGLHAPFPLGIQGNGALEVLLAVDLAGLWQNPSPIRGFAFGTHVRPGTPAGDPFVTALHTGDLLPPADVPLGGPAEGASARYRVSAAPPGMSADHAQTVGPAYLPGTVVAERSAAEGALDYPVGLFLFQNDVSAEEMGCIVIKPR